MQLNVQLHHLQINVRCVSIASYKAAQHHRKKPQQVISKIEKWKRSRASAVDKHAQLEGKKAYKIHVSIRKQIEMHKHTYTDAACVKKWANVYKAKFKVNLFSDIKLYSMWKVTLDFSWVFISFYKSTPSKRHTGIQTKKCWKY